MPMTVTGMEAVVASLELRGANVEAAARKAVKAGAQLLAQRIAEAAPVYHGPPRKGVVPGELRDSIKAGPVKEGGDGSYMSEVKPTGADARGEDLARIGNVLEHGRSDMAPQPFFHSTAERSRAEVEETMRRVFEAEQAKAGGG